MPFGTCIGGVRSHTYLSREHAPAGVILESAKRTSEIKIRGDISMKKLHKSSSNRMICGVCGGIAEYLGVDPTVVRLVFAGLGIAGGSGVLLYLAAAVIMPAE